MLGQLPVYMPGGSSFRPQTPRASALPSTMPTPYAPTIIPMQAPSQQARVIENTPPGVIEVVPSYPQPQIIPTPSTIPGHTRSTINIDSVYRQSQAFSTRPGASLPSGSPWTGYQQQAVPIPDYIPAPSAKTPELPTPVPMPAASAPQKSKAWAWLLYAALGGAAYYTLYKG